MTNLVVSTLEDGNNGDFSAGDLSLREAIEIADPGATITFDSNLSGGSIVLNQGELLIDQDLTIQGFGANNLTIDGSFANGEFPDLIFSRVFNINDGDDSTAKNVTIEGITITGGSLNPSGSGGGILNQENLTLNNSVVSGNGTTFGSGAGIANTGHLALNASIISGNIAGFRGAGGGGIFNTGTAIIVNSSVANNSAFTVGGGIDNAGTLEIVSSTISNNSAAFTGDGITGSATITSSIVAGNSEDDLQGSFTSGGNNLIGNSDDTGFTNGVNGDLVGTADAPIDPLLGELQDNGGATPTIALLDGSPAIDGGSNPNGLAFDQRGDGFNRTIGNGTDIGAFEVQTVTIPEIVGTGGGDVLSGTEAGDRLIGLDGNDTIRGLDGFDTLLGDNGNDSLDGGASDDLIFGSEGFDSLFGGDGNDFLEGGLGVDFLRGDEGDDQLFGQEDNDTLIGSNGNDTLNGGFGIDSLDGGAGNDRLFGQENNDTLIGGNGNDFLDGGVGSDSLRGDDGDDIFVLTSGGGTDFIVDFGRGNNLLGLSSGIGFGDLAFSGNEIILGTETLATLNGFDTANLTESDFIAV